MADRTSVWTAVANFASITRQARDAERSLEALRKKQAEINRQSSTSAAINKAQATSLGAVAREAKKNEAALTSLLEKQRAANTENASMNRAQRSSAAAASKAAVARTTEQIQANLALLRAQRQVVESYREQERAAANLQRASSRVKTVGGPGPRAGDAQGYESISRAAQKLSNETSRVTQTTSNASRTVRKVGQDAKAAGKGFDWLHGSMERTSGDARRLEAAAGGAGRGLGKLESFLGSLDPKLSKTSVSLVGVARAFRFMAIPAVITGFNILTAAVSPLTAGLFGLVGALGPVSGLLGGLPGLLAGAAGGIGTLIAGFAGIGGALKGYVAEQKKAATTSARSSKQQETEANRAIRSAASRVSAARRVAKAERDAREQALNDARAVADARRAVADAQQQAKEREQSDSRDIANARRSLADAREAEGEAAITAARNIVSAQRTLVSAQEAERQAEINITRARKEAQQQVDDLRQSIKDLALEEESAGQSVEEAQIRLRQAINDPGSTDLQRREAQTALKEAQARLGELQQQDQDSRKQLKDSQAKGIEGSDQVVQAKKDEADAHQSVIDAQQGVADAQKEAAKSARDSARAVIDAQRGVSDAQKQAAKDSKDSARAIALAQRGVGDALRRQKSDAIDSRDSIAEARQSVKTLADTMSTTAIPVINQYDAAMKKLTPEARAVVTQLISMKKYVDQLRATAQKGMLPGFLSLLKDSTRLVPTLNRFLDTSSKSFGGFFESTGKAFSSDSAIKRWGIILGTTNTVIDDFLDAASNVAGVISDILTAGSGSGGLTEWLSGTILGWTQSWKAMTSGEAGQKRLKRFFKDAQGVAEQLGRIIHNTVGAIFNMGRGTRKVGDWILDKLDAVTKKWNDWAGSVEGQNWLHEWADKSIVTLGKLGETVKGVFKQLQDVASRIDLNSILDQINKELIPALGNLAKVFTGQLASDIVTIATNIANILAAFGTDNIGAFSIFTNTFATFTGLLAQIMQNKGAVGVISALIAAMAVKKSLGIIGAVTGVSNFLKAGATVANRGGGLGGSPGGRAKPRTGIKRAAGFAASTAFTAAGLGNVPGLAPNRSKTDAAARGRAPARRPGPIARANERRRAARAQRVVQSTRARRASGNSLIPETEYPRRGLPPARTNPIASIARRVRDRGPDFPEEKRSRRNAPAPRRAASTVVPPKVAASTGKAGSNIGSSLTSGLSKGMSASGPVAKITTIAEKIIAAAKKTFGIHSPSTRFIAIGEQIAQGLIKGMQSFAGRVDAEAVALAGGATAAASTVASKGSKGSRGGPGRGKDSKGRRSDSKGSKKAPKERAVKEPGFGKIASGAAKAGGAVSTLTLLLSFLPGKIGEIASKASTFIFILSLIGPAIASVAGWLGPKLLPIIKVLGRGLLSLGKIFGSTFLKIGKVVITAISVISKAMLANPWMLLITALIVIVILVIKYWDQIKSAVTKAALFILSWLKKNWPTLIKIILGPLGFLIVAVVKHWGKISSGFMAAVRATVALAKRIWAAIKDHFLNPIIAAAKAVLDRINKFSVGLYKKIQDMLTWVKKNAANFTGYLTAPFKTVAKTVSGFLSDLHDDTVEWIGKIGGAIDKLKEKAKSPINWIIRNVINKGILGAYNWVAGKLGLSTVPDVKEIGASSSDNTVSRTKSGNKYLASGGYAGNDTRGRLRGPGTGTSDSILGVDERGIPTARVSAGEFVVRKKMTDKYRHVLESINAGKADFAVGGTVPDLKKKKAKLVGDLGDLPGYWIGGGIKPAAGDVTRHSGYSNVTWAGDINEPGAQDIGHPIRAWKDGVIASVKTLTTSYGKHIRMNHPAENQNSLYAHQSRFNVRAGQTVKQGQVIGYKGDTGNVSGPHLHFEYDGGRKSVSPGAVGRGGATLSGLTDFIDYNKELAQRSKGPLAKLADKVASSPLAKLAGAGVKKMYEEMKQKVKNAASSVTSDGEDGGAPSAPITGGGNVSAVRQAAVKYGWNSGGQWNALYQLVKHESGFRNTAQNPTSSAYGLFQFLDSTWRGVGGHKTSNPNLQSAYGMKYIKSAYGSPGHAWAKWQSRSPHWYARGTNSASPGWSVVGEDGPELMKMKGGEKVKSHKKTKKILDVNGPISVQGYYNGGVVNGVKPGSKGPWVRAIRERLFDRSASDVWDSELSSTLKKYDLSKIRPFSSAGYKVPNGGISRVSALISDAVKRVKDTSKKVTSIVPAHNRTIAGTDGSSGANQIKNYSKVKKWAYDHLGIWYKFGANGPRYDCSSYTMNALRAGGYHPPRTAHQQQAWSSPISKSSLVPGDLGFLGRRNRAHHVGLYVGNNKWASEHHTGTKSSVRTGEHWDNFGRVPGANVGKGTKGTPSRTVRVPAKRTTRTVTTAGHLDVWQAAKAAHVDPMHLARNRPAILSRMIKDGVPANRRNYLSNSIRGLQTRYANDTKALEGKLGLSQDGFWGNEVTNPLAHILDHAFGNPVGRNGHGATDDSPWLGASNTAIQEQKRTNAINAEFDRLQALFKKWGFKYLNRKFSDLGPTDGLDTMRKMSKSWTLSRNYNDLLKVQYDREDKENDPKEQQMAAFIQAVNSGTRVGLQGASNAASVSLDTGVSLYDTITARKQWGSTPYSKFGAGSRLAADVASFRQLFNFKNFDLNQFNTARRSIGFATGGTVGGTGNSDTVPAMLTPQEYVLRKKAAAAIERDHGRGTLDYLNHYEKYANGGFVANSMTPGISIANNVSRPTTRSSSDTTTVGGEVHYHFDTQVNNPIAEKTSVSVQKRVQRIARLGLLAGDVNR